MTNAFEVKKDRFEIVIVKIDKLVSKYKVILEEFQKDQTNDKLRNDLVEILIKISEATMITLFE